MFLWQLLRGWVGHQLTTAAQRAQHAVEGNAKKTYEQRPPRGKEQRRGLHVRPACQSLSELRGGRRSQQAHHCEESTQHKMEK